MVGVVGLQRRNNKVKILTIELPDGSKRGIPVDVIARDRAAHYAHEFDGDIEKSLTEDTLPMFDEDPFEIEDWAANNMNWSDVSKHAIVVEQAPSPDMQEVWMNGEKEIIEWTDK